MRAEKFGKRHPVVRGQPDIALAEADRVGAGSKTPFGERKRDLPGSTASVQDRARTRQQARPDQPIVAGAQHGRRYLAGRVIAIGDRGEVGGLARRQ